MSHDLFLHTTTQHASVFHRLAPWKCPLNIHLISTFQLQARRRYSHRTAVWISTLQFHNQACFSVLFLQQDDRSSNRTLGWTPHAVPPHTRRHNIVTWRNQTFTLQKHNRAIVNVSQSSHKKKQTTTKKTCTHPHMHTMIMMVSVTENTQHTQLYKHLSPVKEHTCTQQRKHVVHASTV